MNKPCSLWSGAVLGLLLQAFAAGFLSAVAYIQRRGCRLPGPIRRSSEIPELFCPKCGGKLLCRPLNQVWRDFFGIREQIGWSVQTSGNCMSCGLSVHVILPGEGGPPSRRVENPEVFYHREEKSWT